VQGGQVANELPHEGGNNVAIDEVPQVDSNVKKDSDHTQKFVAIVVVLAALVIGEGYTLIQFASLRKSVESQQQALSAQLEQKLSAKVAALENSTAQGLEALRTQLEETSANSGKTGKDLRRARALVVKLQKEQQQQKQQAVALKQELAQKADQQQVGLLNDNLSATRTDLDTTKKVLDATRTDLGMARSQFGTLIARNHDEIEQLRRLGERDYFEFTLYRKQPVRVAGVGLDLRKTNVKRHRFNLNLLADDMVIEKKNRTINEPVFFYIQGSKRFYELVVNKVESGKVVGYISTPKGAAQVATRSEGAR
jgi:hypothetical protein